MWLGQLTRQLIHANRAWSAHFFINYDNHMSYVEFLRSSILSYFTASFNDKEKDGGFQLLDLFMSSQQDNRSDSTRVTSQSSPTEESHNIVCEVLHICGSRVHIRSSEKLCTALNDRYEE